MPPRPDPEEAEGRQGGQEARWGAAPGQVRAGTPAWQRQEATQPAATHAMNPECHLEDDGGGTEAVAIEAVQSDGHRQSLWVRVGPVYYGGEQAAEPGVWITYQENHMHTPLAGPVLLTPAVWRELSAAVEERLARHEKGC